MSKPAPIAVVGLGGVFPGAETLDAFWRMIVEGRDAAGEPPAGRWVLPTDAVYDPAPAAKDKVRSRRGCYLGDWRFNPEGFALDAGLLTQLDPMFHLALEAGRQASRAANLTSVDPRRIGVVFGNIALPTEGTSRLASATYGRLLAEAVGVDSFARMPHPLNRYPAGLPAGLTARALGFGGGGFTLDAACASSLYALELASRELRAGRADAMLAGGLSRPDSFYTQMGFSQLRAVSPDGVCSPFDRNGNGLVVGEGCGLFMLKRLDDALAAGDSIHGLLKAGGLSNDIEGNLLAPSSEGQLRAMRAAYAAAGWDASSVDLIECHATGTPVGDAVELASLKALWGEEKRARCVIGSVKSNVGHLLTGAGAAGLMKVLLALKHKTLPPTAHFSAPADGLEQSPFRVLAKPEPWIDSGRPRRAAVSGFGFGGINAHLLVEEWRALEPAERPIEINSPSLDSEPIAIVGMGAHFGPWDDLRSFSERALGGGTEFAVKPPAWRGAEASRWFKQEADSSERFHGHFISEVRMPFGRFRIPPSELREALPQQLLMLKAADEAATNAGWGSEPDPRAGVFIGLGLDLNTTNYHLRWDARSRAQDWAGEGVDSQDLAAWTEGLAEAAGPALSADRTMGALGGIVASRVSRELRAGGPSFTVQGEEASGLRALELAVRSLRAGEIDRAVVGAVDLAGDLRAMVARSALRPYSAGQTARPFDAEADGCVPGEGAAAVVLKRLKDAVEAGDTVYAVVRGMGSAGGGGVLESATPEAYAEAARRAFADAGVKASAVSLVEAHAGGDPDEDRAEAEGLSMLGLRAAVTSVKADVGHAGAASSLAGLVKAACCLYQEILPPLRGHRSPRPELSPSLEAQATPRYWLRDRAEGPRRALVAAMGVDGSCLHAVLESFEPSVDAPDKRQPLGSRGEALFAVAGEEPADLISGLGELRRFCAAKDGEDIEALARSWHAHRPARGHRACALVARNNRELNELTRDLERTLRESPLSRHADKRRRAFYEPEVIGGEVAFVYPGSGNQFPGMGRVLGAQWPEILRRQDAGSERLKSQMRPGLFWADAAAGDFHDDAQALIFGQVTLGTLTTDLLRELGVEPSAVVGYSLGETAALFSTRAWRDRDEMLKRTLESSLFTKELAGPCEAARRAWRLPESARVDWALGVVNQPAARLRKALKGKERVYLLIVNTPGECVIGGDRSAVEALTRELGGRFHPVRGVTTVHCSVAESVRKEYRDLHLFTTRPPEDIRFYSGYRGQAYAVDRDSAADSILDQALYGVDYPKTIESAYADGARIFLEMGPGASCTRMIGEILGARPHLAASVCFFEEDGLSSVLRMLAQLVAARVPVDLDRLYGGDSPAAGHRPPKEPGHSLIVRVGGEKMRPPQRPRTAAHAPSQNYSPRPSSTAGPAMPARTLPAAVPVLSSPQAFTAVGAPAGLVERLTAVQLLNAKTHGQYLEFSQRLAAAFGAAGGAVSIPVLQESFPQAPAAAPAEKIFLNREQCLAIARGTIGEVLGPRFAAIDAFPTRVRLPDEPLMLVDRMLEIEGEPLSMTSGRLVTEHDVHPGAWYLDDGRAPVCISVEAGQADLFLSGWLGIDFETKGEAVYRLLDAVVTFHRGLPRVGETMRYDIRIKNFFHQGATRLFRFEFDGTINGEPFLTMREGCAGFFSQAELDGGKGIVHTALDKRPMPGKAPSGWTGFVELKNESMDDARVGALREGNLSAAFGPEFSGLPLARPARLPGGRMKLIDRILELEPGGGRFGLGRIKAEADIHPTDWFLTCHFIDDQVMPGTLMYECCLHALRVLVSRMGFVGEAGAFAFEPVPGIASRLKCRGQVIPSTKKAAYEISLKEIGFEADGTPYFLADALMYSDGRAVVEMIDMSARLPGLTRAGLEALWSRRSSEFEKNINNEPAKPKPAIYTNEQIMAFAVGKPSEAFGEPYRVFDSERVIARLPGPPYKFLDRIVEVKGKPFELKAGASCEAEYDVPSGEWYFAADRQPVMPFAVLLEAALQPCGWLAAYCGSALSSQTDLSFRNLGGSAVQHLPIGPDAGTLSIRAAMTRVSASGGMVIQNFDYEVRSREGLVYKGDTYFGFFSKASLRDQVGIREAKPYEPSSAQRALGESFPVPREAPFSADRWRMLDTVDAFLPEGGPDGLGYIEGSIAVDPSAWFYAAHFYQDPVWPGSLGLESFLQLLKIAALRRWGGGKDARFESMSLGRKHQWTYRGQILPTDKKVRVVGWVTGVDEARKELVAEGYLSVDGRLIYHMKDFAVRLSAGSDR